MLDGMPLIDVHLHAARLPTLKPAWTRWAHDFGVQVRVDELVAVKHQPVPLRDDDAGRCRGHAG